MYRIVQRLRSGLDRLSGLRHRASRHDLVLAVIPATFLVATLLGTTLSVSATTAVTGAAAVSGLAVMDALFFNPPREPTVGEPPA